MQVIFCLSNGERLTYEQSDPEAAETLLLSIKPSRIFSESGLPIATSDAVESIATRDIEMILFKGAQRPDWQRPEGIEAIRVIPKDAFARGIADRDGLVRMRAMLKPGDRYTGFARLTMRSHQQLQIEYTGVLRGALDQRVALKNFLTERTMFLDSDGGSFLLLNVGLVSHMELFPGPPVTAPGTWNIGRV